MSIDPETMEELLANETARLSLRPLRVGETVRERSPLLPETRPPSILVNVPRA